MDCQENEYWDQWGRCVTCQQCGPGQELSKDCGYGEGGDAYCTACPPRRYKSSWGHHRCQSCINCAVINRVQKANCTPTSNAVCGDCLPRFYRKTRIGGLQDQECIPCTKQTPTSEVQCAFQLSLVKADAPTVPPQEATLVALVSSLLVVFTLAFLGLFFLYCKQFFNRHCQRVAGGSVQFEADEAAEEESLFPKPPGQETSTESPVSESILRSSHLTPSWMTTAARLVASPHRSPLPWPLAPQRATPTGSTPPSNAQSWTCKSFPALPPILELRRWGGTQTKALETGWSPMCPLKLPALNSTEVSWAPGSLVPSFSLDSPALFL
uniref:Ectodysplasin A2 receptor n=1 Tax=Oryctolagus cuniculus TaxID=9986 RepID=G1TQH8_RABIT